MVLCVGIRGVLALDLPPFQVLCNIRKDLNKKCNFFVLPLEVLERDHKDQELSPGLERNHLDLELSPVFERSHKDLDLSPGFERSHKDLELSPGLARYAVTDDVVSSPSTDKAIFKDFDQVWFGSDMQGFDHQAALPSDFPEALPKIRDSQGNVASYSESRKGDALTYYEI